MPADLCKADKLFDPVGQVTEGRASQITALTGAIQNFRFTALEIGEKIQTIPVEHCSQSGR